MTASQLAQLFTNLGNPLPNDRLSAIMQEYDVSKSGQSSSAGLPMSCTRRMCSEDMTGHA